MPEGVARIEALVDQVGVQSYCLEVKNLIKPSVDNFRHEYLNKALFGRINDPNQCSRVQKPLYEIR